MTINLFLSTAFRMLAYSVEIKLLNHGYTRIDADKKQRISDGICGQNNDGGRMEKVTHGLAVYRERWESLSVKKTLSGREAVEAVK